MDSTTDAITQRVLAKLNEDIESGNIVLPTLPEIAHKVGRMVEDPNTTVAQVAQVIKNDVVLSARLLQIANSPLYRPTSPATSVQVAVTRLGTSQVRSIVTALVTEQLYKIKASEGIKWRLKTLWHHSVEIAALSHVFARIARLPTEEALLAGLLHEIGAIPILVHAGRYPELLDDNVLLDNVIKELHCKVGAAVLTAWNFPSMLIDVARDHEDIYEIRSPLPDLTDVVIVANLHHYMGTNHALGNVYWEKIPSLDKLGLTAEASLRTIQQAQHEVDQVHQLLMSA